MNPSDYWRSVGAPKVRARKLEIGRGMTNESIAEQIEIRSGKRTTRKAFENFMNGIREPYVSQLVALCSILELDVREFFASSDVPKRQPLAHRNQSRKPDRRQKVRTVG